MPSNRSPSTVPQKADIQAACGSAYFSRGQRYFRENRVQALRARAEPGGGVIEVESRVGGSGGRTYRQDIRLGPTATGFWIEGACSCPMAYNCKHVAAAMLGLQEQPELVPPMGAPTPADWIKRLQSSAQADVQAEDGSPDGVRYIFAPVPGPDGAPEARVALENLGDGGDQGGVVDVHALESLWGGPPPDREIAALLEAASLMAGSPEIRLTGAAGGAALQRMIQSGRCFW